MNRTFFKYLATSTVVSLSLAGTNAFATENLYSVIAASNPDTKKPSTSIQLNPTAINHLQKEARFNLLLPTGGSELGEVAETGLKGLALPADSNGSTTVISLDNSRGSLEVSSVNNQVTSLLFYDNQARKYFKADIDQNGTGFFKEEKLDKYQCAELPVDNSPLFSVPEVGVSIPNLNKLKNLESKPDAPNTLYINYWGGRLSNTAWNDSIGRATINYAAFDKDNDPSTFSENERYLMWLAWQEAAEDYASFNINVTTSQAVYDATASTNRSQMIATTTNVVAPGAGGVAYLGGFGDERGYYSTGWTFNLSADSMGMTHSHEAGHQMGLNHDGTSSLGYYGGHGNWGPIMGAPFGKPFVQWSKGEYPRANNQREDDLAIIANVLGASADDAGNTTNTATPLSLPVIAKKGYLSPDGLTPDTDVYSFTLPSSSEVSLEIIPLLGHEAESSSSNLAMNASLKDSSNSDIASMTSSDNLPLNPKTNKLSYNGTLGAGTYYVNVTGVSPDQNWSTGFGEYGNEGIYRLNIEATGGPATPDDFATTNSRLSASTVSAGQSVTGYTTQTYSGDKTVSNLTPAPSVGYYFSTNSTLDNSDQLLASDSSSIGSDNTSENESAQLTIPAGTRNGNYYILFVADDNNTLQEDNERNNIQAVQLTVSNAVSDDDIYVSNSHLSLDTVQTGQYIRAYTKQAYTGTKRRHQLKPYPYVGYYLSKDDQLDSSDTLLATDPSSIGRDDPNDPESARLRIPTSTPAGTHHILFVADYKKSHSEQNEANNIEAIAFNISASTFGDLSVSNSRLSLETVPAGQYVSAYTTQAYSGTKRRHQLKPYPYVGYYLSKDNQLDTSDTLLATDPSSIGSDDPSDPESARLRVPSSTTAGTYYILFAADYKDSHEEGNESNNVQSVRITVN